MVRAMSSRVEYLPNPTQHLCLNAKRRKKEAAQDYWANPHQKLERLPAEDSG